MSIAKRLKRRMPTVIAVIAGDRRGRAERVPRFDGGGENLAWRGDHRGGDMP